MKLKKFKKSWKKHRHFVITGSQIVAILGIIAGVITTYWQVHQNTANIKTTSQWVGDNLGGKTTNIFQLRTDFTNLENKVEIQGEEINLLIGIFTNIEAAPDEPTDNVHSTPL